ncbi:Cof-type HAD-IIB family hydrolase [Tepidanaerobacter sp. EBM-38]|uniref:Cof-type HAD-IIB family hydrolase n=1 Tax=Tepidanaerobacter sp. EBM-38 TaxID=1918496 RepID=UPI000A8D9629|nr:Cof-type HAD-IIB family hydrolase [Tepidanaerobacter sp. EBM-38]
MANEYKWIVCDLDGTLLNAAGEITDENRKAIEILKAKGKEVIIATGRHDLIANKYLYELDLATPIIACNGALIKDVLTGEILYMKTMEPDIAAKLVDYCKDNRLDYLVYTPEGIYYSENSKRINLVREYNMSVKKELQAQSYSVKDLDISNQDIIKVLINDQDKHILERLNKDINTDNSLAIVSSGRGLIDIMSWGVSKGNALITLSKHLDIDFEEIVVFGDNHNDISMFEVAGLSIAVDNAEEELKKVADYVTLSNDMSGVGYAIYKYVLNKEG